MLEAHKVPTHLDEEEKFIFGLTIRQCLICAVGAALGWGLFLGVSGALPLTVGFQVVAFGCGALVFAVSAAVAFFRYAGRGVEQWFLVIVLYGAAPKWYRWSFNQDVMSDGLGGSQQEERGRVRPEDREVERW